MGSIQDSGFKSEIVNVKPGTAHGHVPYIPAIHFVSGRDRPVRLSWQFEAIARCERAITMRHDPKFTLA
jgi:hypothetical protein